MLDLDAAEILGLSEDKIGEVASRGRMTRKDIGTLQEGIFRPLAISRQVAAKFARDAAKLGIPNPFEQAYPVINRIREILSMTPLSLEMFPELFNPFKGIRETAPEAKTSPQLFTPEVNPTLVGQGANTVANPNVMQTGLTSTEMALLSDEEKAMRLKQRGYA